MVFGIADMIIYTPNVFLCNSSTREGVGVGKDDTDNSVENIVFGNTEISHPFNHTVPQRNVARMFFRILFSANF